MFIRTKMCTGFSTVLLYAIYFKHICSVAIRYVNSICIWNYLSERLHTLSKYFSKCIDISLEDIRIPVTLFQSTITILSLKISIVPGNGNCTNRMSTSFGISLKCNEFLKFMVLIHFSMIFFDF